MPSAERPVSEEFEEALMSISLTVFPMNSQIEYVLQLSTEVILSIGSLWLSRRSTVYGLFTSYRTVGRY